MVQERGIADVLRDTVSTIQDIIRSEVILAKIELKEEGAKAKAAATMFGAAAIFALFGLGFCLLCAVYALTLVMPAWLAALIVGVALLLFGGMLFLVGRSRWATIQMPKKTMFTVKEDLEWMHNQSKS